MALVVEGGRHPAPASARKTPAARLGRKASPPSLRTTPVLPTLRPAGRAETHAEQAGEAVVVLRPAPLLRSRATPPSRRGRGQREEVRDSDTENVGYLDQALDSEVRALLDAAHVLNGDVEPLGESLLGQPTVFTQLPDAPPQVRDDCSGVERGHARSWRPKGARKNQPIDFKVCFSECGVGRDGEEGGAWTVTNLPGALRRRVLNRRPEVTR